jgi:hypothetical protein
VPSRIVANNLSKSARFLSFTADSKPFIIVAIPRANVASKPASRATSYVIDAAASDSISFTIASAGDAAHAAHAHPANAIINARRRSMTTSSSPFARAVADATVRGRCDACGRGRARGGAARAIDDVVVAMRRRR